VSLGESFSNLRNYLTPEEKKSRLLPVGLATNATAWVAESQCVTSQVREAWQRVPIRRAAFRQALPFPVTIGDNSYEEVFISSSGVIGFDAPKGSELTQEMPYEEAADHVYLALLWGRIDFKPRLGSKMWCGVKEDGNFVASYDTVFVDGDTNAIAKVQVEFIANGDMILRYADLPPCSTNAHRAGFQNLDGGWTLPFDNIRSNTALYLKSFGPLDLTVEDSDTDGDGISDYYELYPTNSVSITDPCNIDSDGDGLMDGEEVYLYATDPGAFSSDASGTGDLWRVTGGFTPSDAPWTNAAPSGSLGILTVTTVLEGGTTNGGAVLRIADQYIPVLFGTTLVSRIAVPRDATNLFIFARGANCDNAIAHVSIEASTFTKIRDPSGVFGWSFTLSPSCVTASGTIHMPAYTITPEVVCFHSPTSKVCRITSADPDIYFVTTQGMVREYTPPTPDMPTNSFSVETVPIQLASMDAALSTRASVTNIPAHVCNPDTGFNDEYPDGESYSTWCKFENGVHVWADGYAPTNCPCLPVFTNAFECICSGDGRRPCECAHATRDPKAMPPNADQTNVLGHAALVIGGTNDLLQVTVPEGTYQPCPLCACASGEPSSADVYRQTSCIEVTPGTLTADGAFSVAGLHPSTNFADTVFMYKLTDYSGAQAVTSYSRKDYTVLGTSVYPADPGHSVSNWFIGCNVTNALTLWTGVKLPSDTGDVTLSVTVESGTPSPLLYVYNRTAQSNELLVTQGQLTFTQNLGEWRSTYCDTNGYVQAYLLCASGGVARVTHSYETYSGQPYDVSCSKEQRFVTGIRISFADPDSAEWNELSEGKVILSNKDLRIKIFVPVQVQSLANFYNTYGETVSLLSSISSQSGIIFPIIDGTPSLSMVANGSELRLSLTRNQLLQCGLILTNNGINISSKAWLDMGNNDPSADSNLTDGNAFEEWPIQSRGRSTQYGNLNSMPPNSPMDKSFFQAAGIEIVTVKYAQTISARRQIMNQADVFYYSGHGNHRTATLQGEFAPDDAMLYWSQGLDCVIISGCSVLDIGNFRAKSFNSRTWLAWNIRGGDSSPGTQWESKGPKYLLGYCWKAPSDNQGATTIVSSFVSAATTNSSVILSWKQANDSPLGRNACAIDCSVSPHVFWYWDETSGSPIWTNKVKAGGTWQ
jgi:hypothetical protein